MSSHTVALDSDAYAALKALKRADESFSEVVKRVTRPWKPILEVAGAWKDLTPRERRELDQFYRRLAEANRVHDEKIKKRWG